MICDNASANDVMVKKLSEHEWKRFDGRGRVQCFAHVLNLIVGVSGRLSFSRRSKFLTSNTDRTIQIQAIIEGATGTEWSKDEYIEVLADFDEALIATDPSIIDDFQALIDAEHYQDGDFAVDQPILDGITLGRVPFTQDVSDSQVATQVARPAGEELSNEEVDKIKAEVAAKTRAQQALMADGLRKVNSVLV